ncbi:DegT/DnrJ/EryC1/StrS family aminotransferase [Desulfofundulus salinus]|uniref:DegT/DnrJ/EryC1/StrS family aminotransferase n=1 Tax=Desulfofundulus salinus TaxID=2419843 RepID=A0A494WTT2_9FIRM|nr:DegT/DnrJ/EryC1/StrS family aminotransferase [Desulfofundulus salinum]RKO65482.1 DegT/DnrJ/EryC1/StrS family aminotransferase [Desulfofundulus salinum]
MEQVKIPVLDLTPEIEALWDELMAAIQKVLKSGQFIMGPNVKAFEQEVAAYLGVKHAIGVNSGTDALVIALRSAGIGPGDEVITTPFTFFATAEAISQVGAIPVFVDIDPKTFNIDPELIEPAITPKTKAILPVHLYGQAADMDPIMGLAAKYNLKVIEDTAQAFGGEYKGRKLGTIGNVGCFSFFPSKNLGAFGDGGLIATNDDEIAEIARMLRVHGARKKYYNEMIGYNSRLDEIQAAILRVKLPHIDEWNEARRQAAKRYNELLKDVPGIVTPYEAPYAKHVYHQYTIRVLNGRRNEVKKHLEEQGISTMIYYPVPVHKLPVYANKNYRLPEAEKAAGEVLSLPIWSQITEEMQKQIKRNFEDALA